MTENTTIRDSPLPHRKGGGKKGRRFRLSDINRNQKTGIDTEALCASHNPTDWDADNLDEPRKRAVDICRVCPVIQACAAYHKQTKAWGVIGAGYVWTRGIPTKLEGYDYDGYPTSFQM